MGELHIEIIHDRIRREYNIETHLGPLQVAYRETVLRPASPTDTLDQTLGDRRHVVTVGLAVRPWAGSTSSTSCDITYKESVEEQLPPDVKVAVENGIQSSYLQGPLLGYPVQAVSTTVESVSIQSGTSGTWCLPVCHAAC
ncbi:hypothetical protein AAFF_G00182510 [Aldrovandia affinis]|uniref:Translation elongation factor EFG/EF2 domain-containing protein n=1 Tax=Aldrovandia affinis TaxID=143900 RepID=A0AAD7R2I7_9TELE|nr:hypothetical protein AAFF_G00182510 [Aldrovandia affinis]